MHMIFSDLNFVEIYLDDITIHSTTIDSHLSHIRKVFERLVDAKLKINPEKCTWFSKEIKLLGHIVSHNKISMDPKIIEAIKDRLPPKNVKEVEQYIGICNYYRRFVKDFSKIATPIFKLLNKETKFVWDDQCVKAFEQLNNALTSYPVLRQPDFKKEFLVYTDASGYALGAILSQVDENNKEYVCAYASRILKGAEIHYGITEKECLAVIFGVKTFRIYLYGTKFKIITDHSALNWLMRIKDPTGRLARWSIYLQAYDFEIIHRKGLLHSNVDTLSRPSFDIKLNSIISINDDEEKTNLDIWQDDGAINYFKTGYFPDGASNKQIKRLKKLNEKYCWGNESLVYINEDKHLKVPIPTERKEIVLKNHLLGHFQVNTTLDRIKENYYWKNMVKDIERVVKECQTCQRHQKQIASNHPAIALEVNGIFDRIGIDLVFGLPGSEEGYKGLLVITEYLTKYPYVKPIKSKTAKEIAENLLEYISIFGAPKTILSDQGTEFNNKIVDTLINGLGVEHKVTSAYNPRTNGMTERFNQTFVESLRKFTENDQVNWTKWIPFVLMSYRSRKHTTTGFSPFELMFGRKMNQFEIKNTEEEIDNTAKLTQRSIEIKKLVETAIPDTKNNISEKQKIQKENQNKNNKVVTELLEIGTRVLIKNDGIIGKLDPRYKGPYKIMRVTKNKNYILEEATGVEMDFSFPLHKLKVISNDDSNNDYKEVEKILEHRELDNETEYLVKWKYLSDNDNEWVKEKDFNTKEIINKYKKLLKMKDRLKIGKIESLDQK